MRVVSVDLTIFDDEATVFERAIKKAAIKKTAVSSYRLIKKSIDARHRDIKILYSVCLYEGDEPEKKVYPQIEGKSAIVVGAGPAGLFCALSLARHGVKPLIFERGANVDDRKKDVETFFSGGSLDENSNVQFGEGGAGTFSDGKLNTQVNNPLIKDVLEDFVTFGAPEDILYLAKPHIGSDNLPKVVKNMRQGIERLGGEFHFNERVTSLIINGGVVKGVLTDRGEYYADSVVLAIGHSSRDTFSYLYSAGVACESKEFAVGFRIEHLQEFINKDRYGKYYDHKNLPPADYKLVSHASDRAVFSFCMCPGGEVVVASSESEMLAVNGMSNYLRSGKNANSAIVCQVRRSDFLSDNPLSGIEFQRKIERSAYLAAGDYTVPVQLAKDFIAGRKSVKLCGVTPSVRRGYSFYDLNLLLPKPMTDAIAAGLNDLNSKIVGFAEGGAVLSAVESRTSSPIRIVRNEFFESVSHKNLYPCGEGCGYAGGIMSAAVDGLKVANAIVNGYLR